MPRVISKQAWIRPLTVPGPLVCELRRQATLHHVDDVLAQDGEELEAVEIASRRDVEALGGGVRRDDEVGAGGEGVPVHVALVLWNGILWHVFLETHQQMRCFSMVQLAPFLP